MRMTWRMLACRGLVLAAAVAGWMGAGAQAPAPARVSGTVKAISSDELTVTSTAGQEVKIGVSEATKFLQVAPGSKDLSAANPTTLNGIVAGDKVLVTGSAGEAAGSLRASRVVVMKSEEIAQSHAAEEEAWRNGGGGLVKSVDSASGTITLTNSAKLTTIKTGPGTKFRRYSADSVKFEDATVSTLGVIGPGDQLRVRGTRSEDGSTITADEVVSGSFRNFSGVLTAVNGTAGTVSLKDLATNKPVTVKVTANSDLRRMAPQMAAMFAARAKNASGPGAAGAGHAPGAGAARAGAATNAPGGAPTPEGGQRPQRPAGVSGAQGEAGGPGHPEGAGGGPGGSARAGMDLSQMLSRLPTETLGGLKVGDAVMIVASEPTADANSATAITLLAGVEPILQASPKGEMVLSPWSVGAGAPEVSQ